tara:strand:+ start:299 stop:565 length:267 start_codon:yes stop_codon:yes gene_type:complete
MPRYDYHCKECDTEFELKHSYKFTDVKCIECNSSNVVKVLSKVSKVVKKVVSKSNKPTVGAEVNKAINDGKEALQNTKKQLSGKVYKK